jgi:hypothetical protein
MPKITYHTCTTCRGRGEIEQELAQFDATPKHTRPDGTHVYACHVCLGECFLVHREPTSRELRGEEEPDELVVSPGMPNLIPPNMQPFTMPVGGIIGGTTIGRSTFSKPMDGATPINPNDLTWTNGTVAGNDKEWILNKSIQAILNDRSLLNVSDCVGLTNNNPKE